MEASSQQGCIWNSAHCTLLRGGGHWPKKEVCRYAALETPFRASPIFCNGPISSNSQFTSPLCEKKASTTLILAQIFALKPPNLEIFSSRPPFRCNDQITCPTLWNSWLHTWKRVECPLHTSTQNFYTLCGLICNMNRECGCVLVGWVGDMGRGVCVGVCVRAQFIKNRMPP